MTPLRIKTYGALAAYVVCMLILAASLGGCNTMTTPDGIFEATQGNGLVVSDINAEQVDAAWTAANALAGADSSRAKEVALYWQTDPISYGETLYAGLTSPPFVRVVYRDSCVVGPNTALVHEFLHVAFFNLTGNLDPNHTAPQWHEVSGVTEDLARTYCGGSLPDFLPGGNTNDKLHN